MAEESPRSPGLIEDSNMLTMTRERVALMAIITPRMAERIQLLDNAYRDGLSHGHGLACHNVPTLGDRIDRSIDWVGLGPVVTPGNIRDYHSALCHASADLSRCYTPFEFLANHFNSCTEVESESLWLAFERGTEEAIAADLATYDDESYGIEDSPE